MSIKNYFRAIFCKSDSNVIYTEVGGMPQIKKEVENMRVTFKYGIRTISGKLDDLVHMAWNKGRVAIARTFIYPTLVAQHNLFREIKQNLATIWSDCSEDFKEDLKLYAARRVPYYSPEQIPAYANYAHFIRMAYSFLEVEPVDLTEIDKTGLEAAGCPSSVAEMIAANLLPAVAEYDDLNNDW